MVHPIVTTAIFLSLSAAVLADIDFTPKESFYLAEATKIPCVVFHNGSAEISYSPPAGWTLSGGGSKVTLHPPTTAQAEATMRTVVLKEPLTVTDQSVKAYGELAVKDLPKDASKVTVVEAGVSSLSLSKRKMMELTYSYALFGQQFMSKVFFLPYEKGQVAFQITARAADFDPLARAFRASLYSLQGF